MGGGLQNGSSLWFGLEGAPNIPVVSASKTITNGTGQAVNELQVVLRGVQSVTNPVVPGPGWSFSYATIDQNSNTVLDWKLGSGTLAPNASVTVSFSINATNPDFVGVAWLSGGVSLGCASQVTAYPSILGGANPSIGLEGNTTLCTQTEAFVGMGNIIWYAAALSTAQLVPSALPKPAGSLAPQVAPALPPALRVDRVFVSSIPLQPGGTVEIGLPQNAPAGANAAVFVYSVGTNSSLSGTVTQDAVQFPVYIAPTTACTSSSQCSTGETCTNGVCVSAPLSCTIAADCPAGQTCTNHVCVVVVPAAPTWALGLLLSFLAALGFVSVRRRTQTTAS